MQICQGKTRTGAACQAAGSGGLCFFHANPDRAKTLGQIGGRRNRRPAIDLQVPDNMTIADLRNVQVQAIRLLLSGEMHAREASALAQLCNSLYRVIPTADLEARLATLEEQIAQEESGTSPDCVSDTFQTDGPEPAETGARLEAEQPSPCVEASTSVWADREDSTESISTSTSASAESGETGEA